MRYMVRKITSEQGKEFYDVFKPKSNETYYEVEAENVGHAKRQVENRKDYLEGLNVDDFDRELHDLTFRNSSERETWNLDSRLLTILYAKFNEYLQVAQEQIDMEYHTYTDFNLKEVTEKELVESILVDIRELYESDELLENYYERNIVTRRLFHNISIAFHSLWW